MVCRDMTVLGDWVMACLEGGSSQPGQRGDGMVSHYAKEAINLRVSLVAMVSAYLYVIERVCNVFVNLGTHEKRKKKNFSW